MNLLLVTADEVDAAGQVFLTGRRADHLRRVLKVEPGQRLRLGVIDAGRGHGRVLSSDVDGVRLELQEGFDDPSAQATSQTGVELEVILALPRPQALHRVLQSVAAMGVRRLDLVRSWRVEKSFFASPSVLPESIRKHLWLGAEQGMVNRLPEVHVTPRLKPFLDDLPGRRAPGTLSLLAHPEAAEPIEQVFLRRSEHPCLQVAIGPEGGWIDREVESFRGLDFHPVSLGPWILKVENALTATLAQLELLRRCSSPETSVSLAADHGSAAAAHAAPDVETSGLVTT